MSKATTRIVYLGKSVADGRMAVNDLAPALQSVGILCEETNALLNPGVAKAEVFVHATQPGSFDVSFELAQTALQQPETLLHAEIIVSAVEILRVLGFSLSETRAAASSIGNLIQFIKWIDGRRIDRVEPEHNGSVQVRMGDVQGDVNINTYNLYQTPRIRQAMSNFVAPAEREGIDRIETRDGDKVVESIAKSEVPYFGDEYIDIDNFDRIAKLKVLRLSFVKGQKWYVSDGAASFYVSITDDDFYERINNREHLFGTGTVLRVHLIGTTRMVNGELKTDYRIAKVLDVLPGYTQPGLLD